MRVLRTLSVVCGCLCWLGIAQPSSRAAAAEATLPWKTGAAKVAITPDESMWMAGYASRDKPSEGAVHDLWAKAIVVEDARGERVAIVTLDLVGISREMGEHLRAEAGKRFGLRPEQLLLNASHTHCGPEIRAKRVGLWSIPEQWAGKIQEYVPVLHEKILSAVAKAIENVEPVQLTYHAGQAEFAFNRRFPTDQGYVNRQYEEGPTDRAVPVLRAVNANGETTAILFGYACHNTVLSFYQFCGDYCGFAQAALEESHPGTIALFVQGAGGDQNPYPRRELEMAQDHGRALARAVDAAMQQAGTALTGELRTALQEAVLEFQPLPSKAALQQQAQTGNKYEKTKAQYLLDRLAAGDNVSLQYPCPIQAVRLGNELLMVAIGGEVVVDYSLRLKREHPGQAVWVAGYSNDVFGYLPSLRVLREGGYEGGYAMTYTSLPGPFTESVEDKVFATIADVLKRVDGSK